MEDEAPAEYSAAVPSPSVLVRHAPGRFHFIAMVAGVILVDQIEEVDNKAVVYMTRF